MGIKELWSILTPHAERKPICELRGKIVAIDLAGWVCESLNVVDYFVHPRHHLKNLFFRTCYLIWEEVTPVFVLEGKAPKLKSQVMEKRTEVQFRGVRPTDKPTQTQTQAYNPQVPKGDRGRSRFNQVLKQCENLLAAMGIQCVQGPGEAEAYCAFLNLKGLVDGVISQDSDCFAYGAIRVYRNFSVSTQGALAAQGGAVDIYDMRKICSKMDFGQDKVIAMALLCGCDYCPDGISGVGRDGIIKLFNKYTNDEILKRLRSWRNEDAKYNALEMRVDDKSICSNCGHLGRTQSHTKRGCGVCRTHQGCDESLWKEERLSIKAELVLRKKALADPKFPSEEIINEFQQQPKEVPTLELTWRQPNVVKFIKQVGHLLQWTEIYCFQKFFPILTRWQVMNAPRQRKMTSAVDYVTPKKIVKKRVLKGVPCLELLWEDEKGFFKGLVPDDQAKEFADNHPKGIAELWSTVEPLGMMEISYPELVAEFNKSKEKPKKAGKKQSKAKAREGGNPVLSSLENLEDLVAASNEIAKSIKPGKKAKAKSKAPTGLQLIDKFFKQNIEQKSSKTPTRNNNFSLGSSKFSTPLTKEVPSDLESDDECGVFDMSDIINSIVGKPNPTDAPTSHGGRQLVYEQMPFDTDTELGRSQSEALELSIQDMQNISICPAAEESHKCLDDLDILSEKRSLSNSFRRTTYKEAKRMSLDDSFDVLVKMGSSKFKKYQKDSPLQENTATLQDNRKSVVGRFMEQHRISLVRNINESVRDQSVEDGNGNGVSFFFNSSCQQNDEDFFEKLMETSLAKHSASTDDSEEFVQIISD